MIDRHERLKRARIEAGYQKATEAADARQWNVNTYRSNENGSAPFSYASAERFAKAFGVNPRWLYFGTGPMKATPESDDSMELIIAGDVRAEAEAVFIDESDIQDDPDYLRIKLANRLVMRIRGDSMSPRYMPGEKLIFGPAISPAELVNTEVMAQVHKGPRVVKILRKGSKGGLWTLYSHNPAHQPIEDVKIDWAREVEGMWKK